MMSEIYGKLKFWCFADRVGPDIPLTHWLLYFNGPMKKLCTTKFTQFGNDSSFRPGAYAVCTRNIRIGERVVIRPGSCLFADDTQEGTITIEDDVLIGSGVHIYVNNHKYDGQGETIADNGYYPSQPVVLKKGCWIGAAAIILPGVSIGENAVVGAGSIVTKSVKPRTVVAGNPARVIKEF